MFKEFIGKLRDSFTTEKFSCKVYDDRNKDTTLGIYTVDMSSNSSLTISVFMKIDHHDNYIFSQRSFNEAEIQNHVSIFMRFFVNIGNHLNKDGK